MRVSTRSRAAWAICEVAVGPALFRQLRQGDEQGGFRNGEPLRLLAEIGQRGGAHAFEIAAIGRQRQVAFEDLALGQPPLDLDGAQHLLDLGAEAAAFARFDQPGELHRQRRAAGDDMAAGGELAGGAGQRQHVDAFMVPEALVLIGDQHVDELLVDLVEPGFEPPVAVRRGEGAQQLAVAVLDFGRDGEFGRQWRREGAVELPEGGDRECHEAGAGGGGDGCAAKDFSGEHGAAPHPPAGTFSPYSDGEKESCR